MFYYIGYGVVWLIAVIIGVTIAQLIRLSFKKEDEMVELYEQAAAKMLINLKKDVDRIEFMCNDINKSADKLGDSDRVKRINKVFSETEEIKRHILQSYLYVTDKKIDELEKQ